MADHGQGPSGVARAAAVEDHTITLDGLRFHYRAWGRPDAPPLVLLHAYTSHARSWDALAGRLADRFRVLALDQRGHGESAWAQDYHELRLVSDLASYVDTLGVDRVAIVGFSIGGYVACSYALLKPARVERMVLVECFAEDPAAARSVTAGTEHIRTLRALPDEFSGTAEDVAAAAAAAFRPLAPYAVEADLRRWMLDGLVQGSDGRWRWRLDPVLRRPGPDWRLNTTADIFQARLAQVGIPTLLLVGDESFTAEGAQRVARAQPDKRLVQLARTGHWVPLDNPDGFQEVVSQFLTEA